MKEACTLKIVNTFVKQTLAPALITAYVKILRKTCQVDIVGAEKLRLYTDAEQAMLPCYWHQQMTFGIDFLIRLSKDKVDIRILVSPSKDGNIGEAVLSEFGLNVFRGSAHRSGAAALREIYLAVSKEQCSVGMAADGPLGPARVVKMGIINLAQLSGAPIIPIANACHRKIHFKSWDHFFLPLPFSRVQIRIGEPILVSKRLSAEELEAHQNHLTNELNQLSVQAEASVSG